MDTLTQLSLRVACWGSSFRKMWALRVDEKSCIIHAMEKCFNIAGPCFPDEHYLLPALERLPGIDDDASKSWDEKIYTRDEIVDGKTIHFIGL